MRTAGIIHQFRFLPSKYSQGRYLPLKKSAINQRLCASSLIQQDIRMEREKNTGFLL
jgi:hypothetical protein